MTSLLAHAEIWLFCNCISTGLARTTAQHSTVQLASMQLQLEPLVSNAGKYNTINPLVSIYKHIGLRPANMSDMIRSDSSEMYMDFWCVTRL